jgi:predicted GIY-YIG superfamily endonuclease
MHTVYILRCADGSYYVGSTSDMPRRLLAHRRGQAAMYTAKRRPVQVVYTENCGDEEAAIRREQ